MSLHRILVLGATFFLVALSPGVEAGLITLGLGLLVYAAMWLYEIIAKRKQQ